VKKTLLLLTAAVLCCTSIASADNFVTYATRAQQNATDFIDWTQLGLDVTITQMGIPSPSPVVTSLGHSAMVGNINGGDFLRVDAGMGWINSHFALGQSLVWTGNSQVVGSGGPFKITLASPAGSVGFGIEPNSFGPFTVKVDLYDVGANPIGSVSFSANETVCGNSCFQGDEFFVGIGDTTGVNIGSIVINDDIGDPFFANDLAIDNPGFTYTTAATPEPGTLVLLGTAVAGLIRGRRHKTKA
jgi:PEP-CTERM motif